MFSLTFSAVGRHALTSVLLLGNKLPCDGLAVIAGDVPLLTSHRIKRGKFYCYRVTLGKGTG